MKTKSRLSFLDRDRISANRTIIPTLAPSFLSTLFFMALFSVLIGCSQQGAAPRSVPAPSDPLMIAGLRSMTPQEATAEFHELANYFRVLYGPMEFKENRFGFNFETKVAEFAARIAQAQSDRDIFAVYAEFIAMFKDGHVGIQFTLNDTGIRVYKVPLFITPVEGRVFVGSVGDEIKDRGIEVGDEVLLVDDRAPMSYLPTILKYKTIATDASNEHLIASLFKRDFFMKDMLPTKNMVTIVFQRPSGESYTAELVWRLVKSTEADGIDFVKSPQRPRQGPFTFEKMHWFNELAGQSLLSMSQPVPFFATKAVTSLTKWVQVSASEEFRTKHGLKAGETPDIFAAIYNYKGRRILLVRNYIYSHSDFSNQVYLAGYRAILDQWQDMADVLVLDQTHNGGGSYCEEFARLFINKDSPAFVQAMNADRKWVWDLKQSWYDEIAQMLGKSVSDEERRQFILMGQLVEDAYDKGLKLTEPVPLIGGRRVISPDTSFTWKKPMLVLIDELAGSCGDAFPMLIKASGTAKLFGKTTMGLGGNVEGFTLSNSQTMIRLTRGLFTSYRADGQYTDNVWIENNGVTPDIEYSHTVDDFRHGFVNYVKTFSDAALEQIKP